MRRLLGVWVCFVCFLTQVCGQTKYESSPISQEVLYDDEEPAYTKPKYVQHRDFSSGSPYPQREHFQPAQTHAYLTKPESVDGYGHHHQAGLSSYDRFKDSPKEKVDDIIHPELPSNENKAISQSHKQPEDLQYSHGPEYPFYRGLRRSEVSYPYHGESDEPKYHNHPSRGSSYPVFRDTQPDKPYLYNIDSNRLQYDQPSPTAALYSSSGGTSPDQSYPYQVQPDQSKYHPSSPSDASHLPAVSTSSGTTYPYNGESDETRYHSPRSSNPSHLPAVGTSYPYNGESDQPRYHSPVSSNPSHLPAVGTSYPYNGEPDQPRYHHSSNPPQHPVIGTSSDSSYPHNVESDQSPSAPSGPSRDPLGGRDPKLPLYFTMYEKRIISDPTDRYGKGPWRYLTYGHGITYGSKEPGKVFERGYGYIRALGRDHCKMAEHLCPPRDEKPFEYEGRKEPYFGYRPH